MSDSMVDHPDHYQGRKFEVIDIIEDYELNFNLGNTLKYILRAGKKGDRDEDLQKAVWYLNRELGKNQAVCKVLKSVLDDPIWKNQEFVSMFDTLWDVYRMIRGI